MMHVLDCRALQLALSSRLLLAGCDVRHYMRLAFCCTVALHHLAALRDKRDQHTLCNVWRTQCAGTTPALHVQPLWSTIQAIVRRYTFVPRLDAVGFQMGGRLLELCSYREKQLRRRPEALDALRFVHSVAWPAMFGKTADDLQQSHASEDEYMITDQARKPAAALRCRGMVFDALLCAACYGVSGNEVLDGLHCRLSTQRREVISYHAKFVCRVIHYAYVCAVYAPAALWQRCPAWLRICSRPRQRELLDGPFASQ